MAGERKEVRDGGRRGFGRVRVPGDGGTNWDGGTDPLERVVGCGRTGEPLL